MINVLIVDDSAVICQLLKHILEEDTDIIVIGMVENGEEAVRFVQNRMPDVITMDINMPIMSGLDAIRRIMEATPVPIIVVSASYSPGDVRKSFLAIEAGAVAIAEKPIDDSHPDYKKAARDLVQTVKLMSEVKVVKRWTSQRLHQMQKNGLQTADYKKIRTRARLVVIGVSTGGPPVLQTILSCLKRGYPFPLVIVQHICHGFIKGLVEWLGNTCPLPIHIAIHGEYTQPGHVYFAPDDFHIGVGKGGVIKLSDAPLENGVRPSVSYLFRSVIDTFGGEIIGVLLTGMGKDGAEELRLMKEKGAVTVAQDSASSVVHGMPGEAIRLNAATHVLPPDRIAELLEKLAGRE